MTLKIWKKKISKLIEFFLVEFLEVQYRNIGKIQKKNPTIFPINFSVPNRTLIETNLLKRLPKKFIEKMVDKFISKTLKKIYWKNYKGNFSKKLSGEFIEKKI